MADRSGNAMNICSDKNFIFPKETDQCSDMHETEAPIQVKGPPDGQYQSPVIEPTGIQPSEMLSESQLSGSQDLQGNATETSNVDMPKIESSIQMKRPPGEQYQPPVIQPSETMEFQLTGIQGLHGNLIEKRSNGEMGETEASIQVKGPPGDQYQPHGIQPSEILEFQITGIHDIATEKRSNAEMDETEASIQVKCPPGGQNQPHGIQPSEILEFQITGIQDLHGIATAETRSNVETGETESPIQVKETSNGEYQPHGIQPPGYQPSDTMEFQLTRIQGLEGNAKETKSNDDMHGTESSTPMKGTQTGEYQPHDNLPLVIQPSDTMEFQLTRRIQGLQVNAIQTRSNDDSDFIEGSLEENESHLRGEIDIVETGFWDETSIGDEADNKEDLANNLRDGVSLAVENAANDENETGMCNETSLAADIIMEDPANSLRDGMENEVNLENYEAVTDLAVDNRENESNDVIESGMDDEAQRTALSLRSSMGDAYYLDGQSTDPETVDDLGLLQRPSSYITENFNKEPEEITVERGSVFTTLLPLFKQEKYRSIHLIENKIVFKNESGLGEGPIKEAFRLFHTEGKDFLYEGDGEVIPGPSADQSEALGRVMFHTFYFTGGFPSFICKPFIFKLLTGRDIDDEECLIKSYINFLSSDDKLILLSAVNDGLQSMSSETKTKLFEVIGHEKDIKIQHNIAPGYFNDSVNETNWRQFLIDLAHLELTEKSACVKVAEEFKLCLTMEGHELGSVEQVKKIIENMNPTPQSIIDMLDTEDSALTLTQDMKKAYGFLERFITSECIEDNIAELFLIFCTSSTNMPREPILIDFNASTGLARAVTVHTCANLLHLPTTYQSYAEFKEEFMNTLTSTESSTFTSI